MYQYLYTNIYTCIYLSQLNVFALSKDLIASVVKMCYCPLTDELIYLN